MQVHASRVGEVLLVAVDGSIRSGESETAFAAEMQAILDGGDRRVLLDLSSVPQVDSTGLGRILQAISRFQRAGGVLKLLQPSKYVRNLLVITKVIALVAVFESKDEALASFGARTAAEARAG